MFVTDPDAYSTYFWEFLSYETKYREECIYIKGKLI